MKPLFMSKGRFHLIDGTLAHIYFILTKTHRHSYSGTSIMIYDDSSKLVFNRKRESWSKKAVDDDFMRIA